MLLIGTITWNGFLTAAGIGAGFFVGLYLLYFVALGIMAFVSWAQAYINDRKWQCPNYLKRYILLLFQDVINRMANINFKENTLEKRWTFMVDHLVFAGDSSMVVLIGIVLTIIGGIAFGLAYLIGLLVLVIAFFVAIAAVCIYLVLDILREARRTKKMIAVLQQQKETLLSQVADLQRAAAEKARQAALPADGSD